MPSPAFRFRYQVALLWARSGTDRYGRHAVEDAPSEVRIRLNDTRSQAMTPNGDTISLDATARVGQAIDIGSRLALGTLAAFNSAGSASPSDYEVYEVKTFNQTGDVRNRAQERTVGLIRFRDLT